VEHKIDAVRLTTAGFADTRPVADNRNPQGRAKNRRVELVKH
jgi:chemotaxis protein MotB